MFFKQVNVMWIGKYQYEPEFCISTHKHDFFQFLYVVDGTGYMNTDYESYNLESDKMFFCPPGYNHEFGSGKRDPLKTIEVKFEIKSEEMYDEMINISGCINVESPEIRNALENLVIEAINKDTLSRDIINMEISLILMKILRHLNNKKVEGVVFLDTSIANYSGTSNIFSKMLNFINKNLNLSISLDDLARLVGHDPAYLCRIFKKEFGITPIKYINDLRIIKAKELLMNSSMNITEIAENLGFYSVHYFSKCFKEKENMNPNDYKKMVRNNIYVMLDDQKDVMSLYGIKDARLTL